MHSKDFLIGTSEMKIPGAKNRPWNGGLFSGKPVLHFAHTRKGRLEDAPKERRKKSHAFGTAGRQGIKVFLSTCKILSPKVGGSQANKKCQALAIS